MLKPVQITAPTERPVTLAEAKAHCRIDTSSEDTLVTSLIQAATDHIDGWTGILGRSVVSQVWREDFNGFPASRTLRLVSNPAISVVVKYRDAADDEQTFDAGSYSLHTDDIGPYLWLKDGKSWPSTYKRQDAVRVEVTAGYGAATDVPQAIKQAILLMVGHWYEHREAVGETIQELPIAVNALLAPYRRVTL